MARWFGLTERCSRFLSEDEAEAIYNEGMLFITTHLELTGTSCRPTHIRNPISQSYCFCMHIVPDRQGELTWALKPKLHTFEHQLLETRRTSCLDNIF